MSFFDRPIIDKSSKQNDLSEQKLKAHLNQSTGFILRLDIPDKGCDFDAELIEENGKATNWRIPIQLKSIASPTIVDNGKFISYSFKTSRLGYLMSRTPSMGFVVLYSTTDDRCYFEYCDKIYQRLIEEQGSDEWKNNETVNIKIPVENYLAPASVSTLHDLFYSRFVNFQKMQSTHGANYGLPAINMFSDFKYDFRNIEHIKKFLSDYGLLLLNNYDFDIIFKMITKVPNLEIYRDKDLLMIAAVSYAETGMYTDSEIFCNKLLKLKLNNEELLILQFVKLKNSLALGYVSSENFLDELKKLSISGIADQNNLTIRINTIRYTLANRKAFVSIPEILSEEIDSVFKQIAESSCSERIKDLLTLWNCENLAYLLSTINGATLGDIRIRESLGNTIPLQERKAAAKQMISLNTQFDNIVFAINSKAFQNNDALLKAYSFTVYVQQFIHMQINYFSFEVPIADVEDFTKRIIRMIEYAGTAHNLFLELQAHKEAYNSLCDMIEIIELAEQGHHIQTHHDKTPLYQQKEKIENSFDFVIRPIVFLDLINNKKNQKLEPDQHGMPYLKDLNDEQITYLANTCLLSLKLPEERLTNIVNEMKAFRMFHQRCNDSNILVYQVKDPFEIQKGDYFYPVRFVLRSKQTGIETVPNTDMDVLLTSWNL